MSEYNIPFHVQEEIMKRLPVKSLIRFRSVSKAWKSTIDSSQFIAAHSLHRHTQPHHLLVSYEVPSEGLNYVSYIDDDTFPLQRSIPTLPQFSKHCPRYSVVGSSQGLLCLYKFARKFAPAVGWLFFGILRLENRLLLLCPAKATHLLVLGFCPVTSDPMIVTVTQSWDISNIETSYRCEAMVYTLSSGKWRSHSTSLPTKPIQGSWCEMVTDRFIYWRAVIPTDNVITSFDVTNESFEVIDLPNSFANRDLYFSKLRESFVIIEYSENIGTVWMMEYGAERAFTKLFTVTTPPDSIVGFRKNGIPLVSVTDADSDDEPSKLVVCQPNSENNNVLEICHDDLSGFWMHPYTETLLLLDRSDSNSH